MKFDRSKVVDVPFSFVDEVMEMIEATPDNTYQILTKRPSAMSDYFSPLYQGFFRHKVPKNVWLGVTVENKAAKERIKCLQDIKTATVRFLSCEPLLEDLGELDLSGIGWVIVGGESGAKARPMKEEWVLNIRRQCEEQNVPFFFKQWGTWGADGVRRSKRANGCLLRGEVVRQWPAVINEDC